MADVENEKNFQEGRSKKTPGQAISSLVFGILGLVLFFLPVIGLLLGITAIVSGALARRKISRNMVKKGKGIAIAGFNLGIIDTIIGVLLIMFFVPNYLNMNRKALDFTVLSHMRRVQSVLDQFADSTKGVYPTLISDKNPNGCKLSELIPAINDEEMKSPYNHKPTNILLMSKSTVFPTTNEAVDILPGDIRVYSNGKEYLILAGGRDGKPLTYRLKSN